MSAERIQLLRSTDPPAYPVGPCYVMYLPGSALIEIVDRDGVPFAWVAANTTWEAGPDVAFLLRDALAAEEAKP